MMLCGTQNTSHNTYKQQDYNYAQYVQKLPGNIRLK